MRRLLNARPHGGGRLLLGLLPIAALILLYLVAAQARHAENPRDKILPTPAAMAESMQIMALQEDPRTGEIPLVADTRASLKRLGIAVGAAAAAPGPCARPVTSLARAILASLMSDPESAPRRSHSASGSSV